MSKVYLIHFDEKLSHAQHYIGFVEGEQESLDNRFKKHRSGQGARILAALVRKKIGFNIVRVWDDSSRTFERSLKNKKNSGKMCPICKKNKKKF